MRRNSSTFFQKTAITSAILMCTAVAAQAENITLLLASDVYEMSPEKGRGGFAKLSTIVKQEKAANPNTLYVHAGDAISPSLMSSFDKGEHVINLMNMTPPDVFVPGNHEFDFGPDIYKQRMEAANFGAILAANMTQDDEPLAEAHKLYTFGDVKVGVYGLAAEDTPVKSSPGDVQFSDPIATGKAQKAALKDAGADIIVAVTHSNKTMDQALIDNKVADVILSGDDHDMWMFYDGKTVFAEALSDARHVLALDLDVSVKVDGDKRKVKWWPDFRVIDSADVELEASTDAQVQILEAQLGKELDVALGKTETSFDTQKTTVRGGESAFGNLVADAMKTSTGADIGFTNGGGIRAGKTYAEGEEISRRHILEELPFGNVVVMLGMSGEQVIEALEVGVSKIEEGAGRFPHVSNITFDADITKPSGKRVSNVKVGGEAIDLATTYKVATNDYIAGGGDGYKVMANAELLLRPLDGKLMANEVMAYIRANAPISPKVEGRINLIK
jgi:2',3'-cyclic-nucleotide 2'-phosphodiesterase (5'-nucleotidase family)